MSDLPDLSAAELVAGYRARDFTPEEAIDALAARIEAHDDRLGAFVTLRLDEARAEAATLEPGDRRPLAGIPFAAKDLYDSAGLRTTYGSAMFADHVPARDAAAVAAVRAAGGILVGKTQTHEFAWGITSVNEALGSARNPWGPSRIAGGSSGGSAVAVAAGLVPLALGSDTAGSIRIPAAFCGVAGLKPTYGRVDTAGLWPLAPSLDHAGPMARTPGDLALLLGGMTGTDPLPVPRGLGTATVVVCPDLQHDPASGAPGRAIDAVVDKLSHLGARVEERRLQGAADAFATFAAIQRAEALFVHEEAGLYPDRAADYGADVRRRLDHARDASPADYMRATAAREKLRARMGEMLRGGALLVTPVSGVAPPSPADTAELREQVMPYTTPQNLAGFPACAIRAGFDENGLPTAVQITGAPWREADVLRVARAICDATPDVQARWPDL